LAVYDISHTIVNFYQLDGVLVPVFIFSPLSFRTATINIRTACSTACRGSPEQFIRSATPHTRA
jgi:hypothetical protein